MAASKVASHTGDERELAGAGLNVSPIATDVQHIDKWQGGHFFDGLFQRFFAALHGERGTIFLPRVTDQTGAEISYVIRGKDG